MRSHSLAIVLGCVFLAASAGRTADPEFGSFWHDGKAELDGYRLTMLRYGQPRAGQAVMVFVTEPFRQGARVKADDPSRNPADVFDAFKLNLVRDFQTGIYDYNTMVSLFVRSDTFAPVKVSFSSAEWCGHVYEELLLDPNRIRHQLSSYFEGETIAGTLPRPAGGMLEDELFVRLRGLRGDFLEPGQKRTLPFLPGTFYRRMTHQGATWSTTVIERLAAPRRLEVPAGTFSASEYVVRVADGREGRFDVESVSHVVTGRDRRKNFQPNTPVGSVFIHRNPRVLPRARLMGRPFYADGPAEAVAALERLGPATRVEIASRRGRMHCARASRARSGRAGSS